MSIVGIRTAFETTVNDDLSLGGNRYPSETPNLDDTNKIAIIPQLVDWTIRDGLGTIGGGANGLQEWELTLISQFPGSGVGALSGGAIENFEAQLTAANMDAIEATDFTTHADGCTVTRIRDFGEYLISGKRYIGCKLDVLVYGVTV